MLFSVTTKNLNWKILTKNLVTFKGRLHYKTIFYHKVAHDVKLINFLFEEKILFCSRYTHVFVFLWDPQISKYMMSW